MTKGRSDQINYADLPGSLPIIGRLADDRILQRVDLQNPG
jgi:hypothetical protein